MNEIAKGVPPLWKNAIGESFTQEHVFNWAANTKRNLEADCQVIIGTDSHMHGWFFRFITVICVYRVGKGGNYYYLETSEPRGNYIQVTRGKKFKGNQKLRMFNEVAKSVELAINLFDHTGILPVIHIDASPAHRKKFTSEFSDQLKGYVTNNGFECVLKPNSFVANAIADKHSKG